MRDIAFQRFWTSLIVDSDMISWRSPENIESFRHFIHLASSTKFCILLDPIS